MGSSFSSSFPNENHLQRIQKISDKSLKIFKDDDDILLRKLFDVSPLEEKETNYERTSNFWKNIGFQRDDPVSDFRGGGILCLENMIYFFENKKDIAFTMIENRSNRDNGENYPWAASSVNITRLVAIIFEIVHSKGLPFDRIVHTEKSYWNFIVQKNGFNRLYCCCFVILDEIFTEQKGKYLDFPRILSLTEVYFIKLLESSETLEELETKVYCK